MNEGKWGSEHLVEDSCGQKWRCIIKKNLFFRNRVKNRGKSKSRLPTCIHHLIDQTGQIAFTSGLFLLFLTFGQFFSQITFTITVQLRPVSVNADIFDDIFLAQFVVETYGRHDPAFDNHQKKEA